MVNLAFQMNFMYNQLFFSIFFFHFKVLLTTPTTPTARMKAIVEASEGFVYLVGSLMYYLRLILDVNIDMVRV